MTATTLRGRTPASFPSKGPAKELECADDEAIVAKAMRMGGGLDLEIWDTANHKRFVAQLHGTKGTKGAR